jgi:hypothetical protein
MADNQQYTACLRLLRDELKSLHEISALQEKVNTAVRNHKWADYEQLMHTMKALGLKIEKQETARFELMQKTGRRGAELQFYAFAARFPVKERYELTRVYRALKLQAGRIRSTNNALHDFLYAQISLVSGILEAAFPDRRGMFYGRYGNTRRADMRSVVLNRVF